CRELRRRLPKQQATNRIMTCDAIEQVDRLLLLPNERSLELRDLDFAPSDTFNQRTQVPCVCRHTTVNVRGHNLSLNTQLNHSWRHPYTRHCPSRNPVRRQASRPLLAV